MGKDWDDNDKDKKKVFEEINAKIRSQKDNNIDSWRNNIIILILLNTTIVTPIIISEVISYFAFEIIILIISTAERYFSFESIIVHGACSVSVSSSVFCFARV